MEIAYYEGKKIIFNQKGGIYILLYLVLHIAWLSILDTPVHQGVERHKEEYMSYMKEVEGFIQRKKQIFWKMKQKK